MATITQKAGAGHTGSPRNLRATASGGDARSTTKSPTRLAVYSGRTFLGSLRPCADGRVEAYDINGRTIGVFPNLKTAADTVSRAITEREGVR
jgi:hypothetical protein